MLGDSTSEDRYLEESERTCSRVATGLRTATGRRVNVHNAAVSGANSVNSLISLFVKVLPMRPVAATMMHVSNDLKQLLYFGSYWETFGEPVMLKPRIEPTPQSSILNRVRRTPMGALRSIGRRAAAAVRRNARASDQPGKRTKQAWWEYMTPDRGFAERDQGRLTAAFAQNVNLFVSMCRDGGTTPILLTQPNRLTASGPDAVLQVQMRPLFELGMPYEEYKTLFDSFNDVVRRVAREREAIIVDLANIVPQEPRFIWDSLHLTAAGAEVAAGPIVQTLRDVVMDRIAVTRS
jgi:hypothetical protein